MSGARVQERQHAGVSEDATQHLRDQIAASTLILNSLGRHHALLIRAHGQVITAESVPAVLIDSIHFVENAEVMYEAATLGRPVPLTAAETADFLRDFDRARHVAKLWKYYVGRGRDSGVLPEDWNL